MGGTCRGASTSPCSMRLKKTCWRSALTEQEAWVALRDTVPAFEEYLAERRLEILRARRGTSLGDSPDLQKAARGWDEKLAGALGRGHEGLRVAASAPRLEDKAWAHFFDYEARLNAYLADKAMLVLCSTRFPWVAQPTCRARIRRPSASGPANGRRTKGRTFRFRA